jgi:LPXTG-site transpeptidase (sortase) family protein
MKRNAKITIGVLTIFTSLCLLLSTYYNTKKNEVFDDMNKLYYDQIVSLNEELDEIDEEEEILSEEELISSDTNQQETTTKTTTNYTSYYIGYLKIPTINLERGFVDINSKYNNVNKNIYVHPSSSYPNSLNGNLILAAHSGTSSVSYFKNLYKLNIDDDVYVTYKGKEYHYKVKNIYKDQKDGTVSIKRNANVSTLTLITCSKNDKTTQTIYICELV